VVGTILGTKLSLIVLRKEAGIILQRVYWHRIICDEFHELISDSVATAQEDAKSFFLDNLHGRIFLGLTGTPHYDDAESGILSFS
jgi:superfamily II DNA or RNA helicase